MFVYTASFCLGTLLSRLQIASTQLAFVLEALREPRDAGFWYSFNNHLLFLIVVSCGHPRTVLYYLCCIAFVVSWLMIAI